MLLPFFGQLDASLFYAINNHVWIGVQAPTEIGIDWNS